MEIIIAIAVVLFFIGWFYNRKKTDTPAAAEEVSSDNGIKFAPKEEAPVTPVAPAVVAPVEGAGVVEAPVKKPRAKKPAVVAKAAPAAKKAAAKKAPAKKPAKTTKTK